MIQVLAGLKVSASQLLNPVFLGMELQMPGGNRPWFAKSSLLASLRFGGTHRFPLLTGIQ